MFDGCGTGFLPADTAQSRGLIGQVRESSRDEARAACARLDAIGELFEVRAECGEREDWAADTWATVGAEVAAVLRVSLGLAGSMLHYAVALRSRPAVAALFRAGKSTC